jgi:hypothetical protein
MEILPYETLSLQEFGVLNANDGDEVVLKISFPGYFVEGEDREILGRKLTEIAMQYFSKDETWKYPDEKEFKVGLVD